MVPDGEGAIKEAARDTRVCSQELRYSITPIAVPIVFVMRSLTPESRVGRNACDTSIVRLVINPKAIVIAAEFLIVRTDEK